MQCCPRCSAVLSVVQHQRGVSEGSSSCREGCWAALPGDGAAEHPSPLSQELWLTFLLLEAQTTFLAECSAYQMLLSLDFFLC